MTKDKPNFIKAIDLIKQLQNRVNELEKEFKGQGKKLRVYFYTVPPENICERDDRDIPIDYKGEICTSLLYNDPPSFEIGFGFSNTPKKEIWDKFKGRYDR